MTVARRQHMLSRVNGSGIHFTIRRRKCEARSLFHEGSLAESEVATGTTIARRGPISDSKLQLLSILKECHSSLMLDRAIEPQRTR